MIYSKKLKELREERNLKLRDIDRLLNFNLDTYKVFENETSIIPIIHLNTLSNYYDVSLDYIFEFSEIKQYNTVVKDIDSKIVGKKLREFRKDNKITQQKLAEVLNTNQSVIANYERGRNIIATPFLYTICKKYSISADYLLGKINEPKYLN